MAVGAPAARFVGAVAGLGVLVLVASILATVGPRRGDGPGTSAGDTGSAGTAWAPSPLATASATAAGRVAGTPSPAPVSTRFGMVAHLLWDGDPRAALADLDRIRDAGLGLVRFDLSWRHTEPQQGRLEGLDGLDIVMQGIADRGMRAVITVIETPGWANGGDGGWRPPDDPGAYARFVGSLAARYARDDVAWEIWNEPNDPRFWQPQPDPAAYTALLVAASRAIHAAAPNATVLGGSILYGDVAFLEGMYAAGAGGAFDGLAVHPYAQVRAPWDTGDPYHSFLGTIDRLRAVMVAHGDGGRGMWLTETGWALQTGVDEQTRADYLAQAVSAVARRPDIYAMAVYVLDAADDPAYGLVRAGAADAGFSAYAAAVRQLAAQRGP